MTTETILIGQGSTGPIALTLKRGNRHGLIAGATGTGKTVTLQSLAEGFSRAGTSVFLADVKGDLAGMAMPGSPTDKAHPIVTARAAEISLEGFAYADNPVVFWDLFGEQGHPIRTTIREMGPLLLARLLNLTDAQEGVLNIAFRVADEGGLLLLDLADLQSMLTHVAENASELTTRYGNVTKASVGAIQRSLLQLEAQGGAHFFGEPALAIPDLIATDDRGRGQVNILAADKLMASPRLYATFLLWLLSELFETLPEIGDPDRPVLAFFFDEAHLLFDDAPKALTDKIEQVVRLIRSKGVGVYFVTQNPIDVPDDVAAQLGNRVQHALRAFTPRDAKAVQLAAQTFRPNPKINVASTLTELRTGEALVSLLQPDGSPAPVDRALIAPPTSRLGPLSPKERGVIVATSPLAGRYDETVDRESAHEVLSGRAQAATAEKAAAAQAAAQAKADAEAAKAAAAQARADATAQREAERARIAAQREADRAAAAKARLEAAQAREAAKPTMAGRVMKSVAQSAATSVGRQIGGKLGGQLLRGLMGGLFK
jgi:hypothetical protein